MALDVKRIRAVCFDVDGTLRDTDDQYVAQLAHWLRPARFLFRSGETHTFARRVIMSLEAPGTLLYSLPDRLGIDNHLTALVEWSYRLGFTRRPDVFWVVLNVFETVQALAARYPLAVISARDERTTLAFLDTFNLRPLFRCVATAHTCAHAKPYPDPVVWAAQQMNVSPHECVMIGDTTVDIRAGKAAGAQTIGVLCGFGREKELLNAGADLIVPTTADVGPLLLGHAADDAPGADDASLLASA
jgi:phosphoglycolate phosphatase-like HAD superfamily hydrolase